jgi:hypothetical protein
LGEAEGKRLKDVLFKLFISELGGVEIENSTWFLFKNECMAGEMMVGLCLRNSLVVDQDDGMLLSSYGVK